MMITTLGRVLLIVVAVSTASCGSSELGASSAPRDERDPNEPWKLSPLAKCLQEAGGQFADRPKELDFFERARDEGKALNFGFTYDRGLKAIVHQWREGPELGERPSWFLWAAQPLSLGELNIRSLVEDPVPGSFVAYLIQPSRVERRQARACINYDAVPPPGERGPRYTPPR